MVNIQLSQSLGGEALDLQRMNTEDVSLNESNAVGAGLRADTEILDEDGNTIQIAQAELGEEAEGDMEKDAAELETIKEGNEEDGGGEAAGEDAGEGAPAEEEAE